MMLSITRRLLGASALSYLVMGAAAGSLGPTHAFAKRVTTDRATPQARALDRRGRRSNSLSGSYCLRSLGR